MQLTIRLQLEWEIFDKKGGKWSKPKKYCIVLITQFNWDSQSHFLFDGCSETQHFDFFGISNGTLIAISPETVVEKMFIYQEIYNQYRKISLVFRENPKNRQNDGIFKIAVVKRCICLMGIFQVSKYSSISKISIKKYVCIMTYLPQLMFFCRNQRKKLNVQFDYPHVAPDCKISPQVIYFDVIYH